MTSDILVTATRYLLGTLMQSKKIKRQRCKELRSSCNIHIMQLVTFWGRLCNVDNINRLSLCRDHSEREIMKNNKVIAAVILIAVFTLGGLWYFNKDRQIEVLQPAEPIVETTPCEIANYTVRLSTREDWLIPKAKKIYGDQGVHENFLNGFRIGKYNNIPDANLIFPGQVIKLPCAEELAKVDLTGYVKPQATSENTVSRIPRMPEVFVSKLEAVQPIKVEETPVIMATVKMSEDEVALQAPIEPTASDRVNELVHQPVQVVVTELEVSRVAAIVTQRNPEPAPTPSTQKMYPAYQVVLHVPQGAVQGIGEGEFPAELLEGQTKSGEWKKRTDTSVEIQRIDTIYHVFIKLDKEPEADALVAIDFQNGYGFPVTSEYLTSGAETMVGKLPRKFKSEDYKSLRKEFPGRPPFIMRAVLRPTIRWGPRLISMGVLATTNPIALVFNVSDIIRGRLETRNDRDQIEMLREEVQKLKEQTEFLLQQTEIQQPAQIVQQ